MSSELSLCGEEIRKTDHDAFLCGLFAPEESRNAFYALHLFYMETLRIRDLVGEAHLGLFRLQYWRDLVDNVYSDQQEQAENGTHKEIVGVLAQKKIDKALFEQYFNARSFDMEDRPHDDMDALKRYCIATGGTVAKIKAKIMDANDLAAVELVGTANSLSEIIRTLPYQSRKGRCKIPLSIQKKNGLPLKSFMDFECSNELKACVQDICLEIQNLIKEARTSKSTAQTRAVLLDCIAIEDYLKRLQKVDFDPFNPNIGGGRLSRQLKMGYRAWKGVF